MVDYSKMMRKVGLANKGKKLSEKHKAKLRKWNLEHHWRPPAPPQREKSKWWKGGIKITKDGYKLIYKPEHPLARKDGYVLEHRLILKISKTDIIHHINHNRLDNQRENLQVYKTSGKHIMENHAKKNPQTGRFE